ncbi:hypothetical protein [Cryobacterium arcticum]|uniref:CAAX protease n=1 Tax=Cryobacterium arcticum TaxID=670052 RepID=A0A1B1BQA0_9MICO|nr:hypothetical protein [Cryobacterium arcticum]ANP74830.1 hypothetical protein PA27867_3920 [Cryobacterium arcticum]
MYRLRATIPSPRMAPYVRACAGTLVEPIDLYRWAGAVALAVFDDLASLEVAMRSAMGRELAAVHGLAWYQRVDLLDDDTLKLIEGAWKVGRLGKLTASPDVIHGKLVATLMFGFWVKVLGRGGFNTGSGTRERRIYDTLLWKSALRSAFPNAGDLDRALVETAARQVQALRNRIAHHEHIVWGVPLPGEMRPDRTIVRLSVTDAHETLLTLAGFVDTGLEEWLRHYSQVPALLAACPLPQKSRLLL